MWSHKNSSLESLVGRIYAHPGYQFLTALVRDAVAMHTSSLRYVSMQFLRADDMRRYLIGCTSCNLEGSRGTTLEVLSTI